jgi:hypothetical protein
MARRFRHGNRNVQRYEACETYHLVLCVILELLSNLGVPVITNYRSFDAIQLEAYCLGIGLDCITSFAQCNQLSNKTR